MSSTTTTRILLVAATLSAGAGMLECGGPPTAVRHVLSSVQVDMPRTVDWVNSQGYQYCNINQDRVCLSPDSVLEFEFPRHIRDTVLDEQLQSDLVIWNEGLNEVRLLDYSITAVDDSNQLYTAVLQKPEEYEMPETELSSLTLAADQRVRLPFSIHLDDSFRRVIRLDFQYRTEESSEPIEVAVSYLPTPNEDEDQLLP